MISERMTEIFDKLMFHERKAVVQALARVVAAAETVTDEIAKSRTHNYQVESAGAKVFVALQALDAALRFL